MTQPTPAEMTDAELNQAIIAASQDVIAARRARPRDQARINATQATYDALIAERDARAAA